MNTYSVPVSTQAHVRPQGQESATLVDWLRETRRLCDVYNQAMTSNAMATEITLKIQAEPKTDREPETQPILFG